MLLKSSREGHSDGNVNRDNSNDNKTDNRDNKHNEGPNSHSFLLRGLKLFLESSEKLVIVNLLSLT